MEGHLIRAPVPVLATHLSAQVPATVAGQAAAGDRVLPAHTRETQGFKTSAWPTPVRSSQLGSESADKILSFSRSLPPLTRIFLCPSPIP